MIITIDGPAGTGKSTVAKILAHRLGFVYFDTGAMYRAVTYKLLKLHVPLYDNQGIKALLENFSFRIETISHEKHYFMEDEDVTIHIRSQQVTKYVSEVSALPVVRDAMVFMQRRFAKGVNAVFEGRDMGTVVFPQAEVKIFLTATPEVRAERRFREFLFKHPSEAENLTKQQVLEDIVRRDSIDSSREHSPLRPSDDSILVDTSNMKIEDVVDKILALLLHLRKDS